VRRLLPIAVVILLLLAGSARAWDDEPAAFPDDYEGALASYGAWVDGTPYGRVWYPAVSYGWRPYVDGHWVWTPHGWTWVSLEPWAWTFHYGRWAFVSGLGWCWVPGFVYAPAWVDWYWGDGFVGWAPLPPFGVHVALFDHFTFVHDRDFCSPRLRTVVVHHDRLPRHFVHVWRGGSHRSPGVRDIERVARHPVVRVNRRPPVRIIRHGDRRRLDDHGRGRMPHAPHPGRRLEPGGRHDGPPSVTSAPVPRRNDRVHAVRPRIEAPRLRRAPGEQRPVLGRRAADPVVPRERFAPNGDHGRRVDVSPPPVRGNVTMHPHAGVGRPSQGRGEAPRHRGGGQRGHVMAGRTSGLR
jgi:hypothetical protein